MGSEIGGLTLSGPEIVISLEKHWPNKKSEKSREKVEKKSEIVGLMFGARYCSLAGKVWGKTL